MVTESNSSAPDAEVEPDGPEPETPRSDGTGETASRGVGRWVMVAVVVLLVYPLARWMMGGGTPFAGGQSVPGPSPVAATELLNQSLQHAQGGRFRDCIETATAATKLDPLSASAFNNIGFCSGSLRLWDDAIRNLQEAARLDPANRLAANNLAWAQQEKAKSLAPSSASDPASAAGALLSQSLQHAQAKRFKECMETAAQSVKLSPTSARAFNNLGFCAGNLRLWDEAIRNLEEATRLDPNLALARNNLAWARDEKAKAAGAPAR